MQSRSDRAHRRSRGTCDIVDWKVAVVAKDHGDPLIGVQDRECTLERVAVGEGRTGVMRGRRVSCSIQWVMASVALPSKSVAAGVDHDAVEPRIEPVGVAEARVIAPGSCESVMGRILGLLYVAENQAGEPIGRVEAILDEMLKGGGACHLGVRGDHPVCVRQPCPPFPGEVSRLLTETDVSAGENIHPTGSGGS